MYIVVVHWLGKVCTPLKAPSLYRFLAHDEHQQSKFFHQSFGQLDFFWIRNHSFIIFRSYQAFFLIYELYSSVITLFFFITYLKTFASKTNSWSYSVNPISIYCQLDSGLSLVKVALSTLCPNVFDTFILQDFPSCNTNGKGVWSIFERSDALKLPVFLNRSKGEWNFLISGSNAEGRLWEQWVFLLKWCVISVLEPLKPVIWEKNIMIRSKLS